MLANANVSSANICASYIRPRYLPRVSKRGLSDEQIARVLEALRRRLATRHAGNVLAFSRELKCSQPALWQIFNDRTRPSFGMAETLAQLEGVSVESIINDPRDRAAELAREGGVPEPAIRRVLEEPPGDAPRPVLWWIDRMRAAAAFFPGPDAPHPVSARTAAAPHDSQTMPASPRPARAPRSRAS